MNPLTQIKNTQRVTKAEIELGLTDKASWHDRFKHSAYVFAGGLPFELTEGDLLAVFAQYGEVVDIHLVRDKKTGGSPRCSMHWQAHKSGGGAGGEMLPVRGCQGVVPCNCACLLDWQAVGIGAP